MIKVNIGCGSTNFGAGWIHIDKLKGPSHIQSDDVELHFFQEHSIDLIYASHFLEYFDYTEALRLLSRWHKKMKDGAILRLAVPDFKVMALLYMDKLFKLESFIGPLYGKMIVNGDELIYHKMVYDFDSLKTLLEFVGFKDVQKYDWRKTEHAHIDDCSQAYLPKMDKQNGTLISLNVECKK